MLRSTSCILLLRLRLVEKAANGETSSGLMMEKGKAIERRQTEAVRIFLKELFRRVAARDRGIDARHEIA